MRTMDGDSSTESRGDMRNKRDQSATPLYLSGEGDSSLLHLLEHTPDSGSSYDDREPTMREIWEKNNSEVSHFQQGTRHTLHLHRSYWDTDSSSPSEHNQDNFRQSDTKSHESLRTSGLNLALTSQSSLVHDPQLSSSTSSMQSDSESKHSINKRECCPSSASLVQDKNNASPSTEHDKQMENGSVSSGESALQNIAVHHTRSFLTQKHNSILSQPDRISTPPPGKSLVHCSPTITSDVGPYEGRVAHHSPFSTWELMSSRASPLRTQDRMAHQSPLLPSEVTPSRGSPLLTQGRKVHPFTVLTSELTPSRGSPLLPQETMAHHSPILTSELTPSRGSPLLPQETMAHHSPALTSELTPSRESPLLPQETMAHHSPVLTSELTPSRGSPLLPQETTAHHSPILTSEFTPSRGSPLLPQETMAHHSPVLTLELTTSRGSPLLPQETMAHHSPVLTSELPPSRGSPLLQQEMMAHLSPTLTSELTSSRGSPLLTQETMTHHSPILTSELTSSHGSPLLTQERVAQHFSSLTSELMPSEGSSLLIQEGAVSSEGSPLPRQERMIHHSPVLHSEESSPLVQETIFLQDIAQEERTMHHSVTFPQDPCQSRGTPSCTQERRMEHQSSPLNADLTPSTGSPLCLQEERRMPMSSDLSQRSQALTPCEESPVLTQEGRTPILTPDLLQYNRNSILIPYEIDCRSLADHYEWMSDSNSSEARENKLSTPANSTCDSSLTEVHISTRKKRRQSLTRVRRGPRKNKISPDRGDTLTTRGSCHRSVSVATLESGKLSACKEKSGSSPNLSSTEESPCDTNFDVFLAMSRGILSNTWHYNIRESKQHDDDIILEDMEREISAKHVSSQTTGELWPPMIDRGTSPYSWATENSDSSSFTEPYPDEANCFCLGRICEIIFNFFSVPRNKNY